MAREVMEVKPTKNGAWVTAAGEQVTRYWGRYRLVLVTNCRDFILVGQDWEGRSVKSWKSTAWPQVKPLLGRPSITPPDSPGARGTSD
ncbi:MAG: hypothetical protein WBV23_10455 [Desulfobaccales bacterium]